MKVVILLAFLLMPLPAVALTLEGSVEKTDIIETTPAPAIGVGKIGIRISGTGRISKVRHGSPAEKAGLQKNDKVTLVNGMKYVPGDITGLPGTTVMLEVQRKKQRFQIAVERVDVKSIY